MGPYEIILTAVFFIGFVICVLCGVKACAQTVTEKDNKLRIDFHRKTLFLMAFALVFLLCALYILFRVLWLIMIVFIIGFLAATYVICSGVTANMREH